MPVAHRTARLACCSHSGVGQLGGPLAWMLLRSSVGLRLPLSVHWMEKLVNSEIRVGMKHTGKWVQCRLPATMMLRPCLKFSTAGQLIEQDSDLAWLHMC